MREKSEEKKKTLKKKLRKEKTMAVFLSPHQLAFIFGLLGMPTFYMIYKKKSSEGYQSIPYVAALCSSILFLYYGFLKSVFLIISINSIGCAIESAYLIFYLIYAPPKEKKFTVKLILLLNVGAIGLVMFITNCLIKGPKRMTAVGWICVAYNIATFAAPLSIVTPNVLGFVFGIAQMILYFIYKNKKGNETKTKQHEEFEGQCKEVSLSSVDRKDNINQPVDIKEMMKVIIVDDQKPTE
ncbi:hypothetical protein EZV62_007503 [Acer yangbiense]|uniref:Bidirectional sugar transporter SWEET n=1 Tax=Acer yangbiense TaxID=1000413 RepID=A0A5C7IAR1_9ROSI|nr:hypothetical protein EZV62_007503 [Acer yangbiense]